MVNAVAAVQPGDVFDCVGYHYVTACPQCYRAPILISRVAMRECAIITATNGATLECSNRDSLHLAGWLVPV
jgi:hypothetical protein